MYKNIAKSLREQKTNGHHTRRIAHIALNNGSLELVFQNSKRCGKGCALIIDKLVAHDNLAKWETFIHLNINACLDVVNKCMYL